MADALAKGKKPEPAAPKRGEDAFIESTLRLWAWMGDNLRTVVVVLAGIGIAVLGFAYYVNFQASVRAQAAAELSGLRLSAEAPDVLLPRLEAYIQRFDGTTSANEARLILARVYLDTDRPTEAARVAADIDAADDEPVGFAARRLLATAQEAAGDAESALATLQSLARNARFDFQTRQVQAAAARILVDLGRANEAAVIYETIAAEAEEEDPAEAGVYRIRLGEISRTAGQSS